ncbi:MAG: TIGR01459 family HAD-type hydrolase [Shimia sp.]
MTTRLDTLSEVAERYDAVVLDQWGVLHDGTAPFPGALGAVEALRAAGVRLAVLSNSGKRGAPNRDRITAMGFPAEAFEIVMTSGEALWRDIADGAVPERRFHPIERAPSDAGAWAEGLDLTLCDDPAGAEAILLMGLADDAAPDAGRSALDVARARGLPVYCTNPDRASPRAGGRTVTSPGALAHAHREAGGQVVFYGKPHTPVFRAMEAALGLPPKALLMVGDSLEHDIAGGVAAGWDTAFVEGGLHAARFTDGQDPDQALAALAHAEDAPMPTYTLPLLR